VKRVKKESSAPFAALVAMILVWGYSWVVMKIALRHAHPFDFAAMRVGIGCVVLVLLVKLRGRSLRLPKYGMAVLLGFLQVALFVALSHFALLAAGPGKTSVLVFTMPFWMIVFAHFVIHERMRGTQWLSVALAFGGLVLIVAPWELTSLTGSLLAVAAGAVWAGTAVLSKKFPTAEADPLLFTAWQLFFGFIALGLLALLHPHPPVRWEPEFIWSLLFSAILATGIGWWLWTYILSRSTAGITGLNSLGIPVVAVIASAIQLGERPPALELAGMVLIGIALGLLAWLGMKKPSTESAAACPVD
jgi:drug/metabolite transporter (DMT)-like permease